MRFPQTSPLGGGAVHADRACLVTLLRIKCKVRRCFLLPAGICLNSYLDVAAFTLCTSLLGFAVRSARWHTNYQGDPENSVSPAACCSERNWELRTRKDTSEHKRAVDLEAKTSRTQVQHKHDTSTTRVRVARAVPTRIRDLALFE